MYSARSLLCVCVVLSLSAVFFSFITSVITIIIIVFLLPPRLPKGSKIRAYPRPTNWTSILTF
jgi:hypothetical protein